ncbi:MAG: Unknown protein [uncultured Sulfurovum sp.]|uniref:Lipoprotein n=1 Tax=uncultured Sulfurovum sp. TaxID=269237 RepID=A0A6S6S7Z3_9BACT|nr:MAG: Unknown protein [uncultured Sulfurovum sp.]
MGGDKVKYIVMCLMVLGLSGCFPKVRTTTPLVEVIVIDAKTKKSVEGVLTSKKMIRNEEGVLSIPATTKFGLGFPASGVYPIEQRFALGKVGYVSQVCLCTTLTIYPRCNMKRIELEASSSQDELSMEKLNSLVERSKRKIGESPNQYTLDYDPHGEMICQSEIVEKKE